MQERHLYEYAIIRVVPRVEREEFINVGIILFSKKAKFIKVKYHLDLDKIKVFSSEIEFSFFIENLESFKKIAQGDNTAGRIAQMEIPERFRWLTAVRSSCIQTSRPHSGLSNNLEDTVESLFREQVL